MGGGALAALLVQKLLVGLGLPLPGRSPPPTPAIGPRVRVRKERVRRFSLAAGGTGLGSPGRGGRLCHSGVKGRASGCALGTGCE